MVIGQLVQNVRLHLDNLSLILLLKRFEEPRSPILLHDQAMEAISLLVYQHPFHLDLYFCHVEIVGDSGH